jgi:protein PhnA
MDTEETLIVKDAHGNTLNEGDSAFTIQDLDLKGSRDTLKRGTVAKNIHLTSNPEEVECRLEGHGKVVLKTKFLKKKA